jgi:hypothetical protein
LPQPELYRRISERYSRASDLTVSQVPEASGFAAYHAFESIGGAWIRHNGRNVPLRHTAKLNQFVILSHGRNFKRGVTVLAIILSSLRNNMLYPRPDGIGGYELPETLLSSRDAEDLLRRVAGVIRRVSSQL